MCPFVCWKAKLPKKKPLSTIFELFFKTEIYNNKINFKVWYKKNKKVRLFLSPWYKCLQKEKREGNLKERETIYTRTLFFLLCNYFKTYTVSSKYYYIMQRHNRGQRWQFRGFYAALSRYLGYLGYLSRYPGAQENYSLFSSDYCYYYYYHYNY